MKQRKTLQLSHMDGMQGENEQRSESYMQYGERAAQISTPQSAISDGGASGFARRQVGTLRKL